MVGGGGTGADTAFRVCLVSREEPGVTGTSRYVHRLEQGLRERGLDVVHLQTRPAGWFRRIVRAAGKPVSLDGVTFLSAYPLWLRWPRADIYHLTVHTYASALVIAPPPGPAAITVHDLGCMLEGREGRRAGIRRRAQALAERLALRGLRRGDSVIAVSQWTRQMLIVEARLPHDRVTVTPLGVDHARYRPTAVPDEFRARHGLPDDHRYLIYVGSDEPRKSLPVIWQALQVIRRRIPNAVLLKVGKGYDPAARDRLIRLAGELGVDQAIRYFDDVPEADLPLFYNVAEALVMPSLYEGFGLPALEAMACGTPAVVSNRGALAEVADGSSALVVDPTDPGTVAEAVLRLLEDRGYARQLSERGIERSRQFTWESTVERTIDVYHRMRRVSPDGRSTVTDKRLR